GLGARGTFRPHRAVLPEGRRGHPEPSSLRRGTPLPPLRGSRAAESPTSGGLGLNRRGEMAGAAPKSLDTLFSQYREKMGAGSPGAREMERFEEFLVGHAGLRKLESPGKW